MAKKYIYCIPVHVLTTRNINEIVNDLKIYVKLLNVEILCYNDLVCDLEDVSFKYDIDKKEFMFYLVCKNRLRSVSSRFSLIRYLEISLSQFSRRKYTFYSPVEFKIPTKIVPRNKCNLEYTLI